MCGIWGLIPGTKVGFNRAHLDIYRQMMVMTALRGVHSTGLFGISSKEPKPKVFKTVGDPYYYLHAEKAYKQMEEMLFSDGLAVVGHGRHATVGAVSVKNAHPFTHNHFTLVHNGTIQTGLKTKEVSEEVEVDSHALCVKIAEVGIEAALKEITNGAYALIMYDADKRGLYMARNAQRPLHYATSGSLGTLVMSEKEALAFLISRNKLWGYKEIESLPPEKVFHVELNTGAVVEGASVTPERKFYPVPSNRYYGSFEGYDRSYIGPSRTESIAPIQQSYSERRPAAAREITFLVETLEKDRGNIKYTGIAEDQKPVVFFTNKVIPNLLSKVGKAPVHSTVYRGENTYYFIRFRDIEWYGDTDDDKTVTLANGRVLTRKEWNEICDKKLCSSCDSKIDGDDHAETLVKHSGKVICKTCLKGVADSGITVANVEFMQ